MYARRSFFLGFLGFFTIIQAWIFLYGATKGSMVLEENRWFLPTVLSHHASWPIGALVLLAVGISLGFVASSPPISIRSIDRWRLLPAFGGLCLTVIPLGHWINHHTFFHEKWIWYGAFEIVGVCTSVAIVLYFLEDRNTNRRRFERWLTFLESFFSREICDRSDWKWIVALSLWVLWVSLAIHGWVLGGIPHVYDELAQLFQAKVFASGYMVMPAPREAEFFERMYIPIQDGRWFSIYPPGFAFVLALGVLAKHPQWINPLVSVSIVPLFFLFARRIVSPFVARVGSLFLALSPFFLLMGSSYMNHPSCLLFVLLFLLFLDRSLSSRFLGGSALISGFCLGAAFLIRPLTALALGGAGAIWIGMSERGTFWHRMLAGILIAASVLPCMGLFLYFNHETTGSVWITGYQHYFDANPLGFGSKPWGENPLGPTIPRGEYHTPLRGLANLICNLNALNVYLLGWPVPSLLPAFLLLLPGMKRTRVDGFCLAAIGCLCGVYFFYFFQDECYGPRFLYESIPFWIILCARGVEEIRLRWREGKEGYPGKIRCVLYGLLVFYFTVAFATTWVERIVQYGTDYWGARAELAQLMKEEIHETNAVVFVEDPNDHFSVFSFLDPRLDRGWIIAHDLGEEENKRLLIDYPEWPVYYLRLKEDETSGEIRTVLEGGNRS